MKGLHDWSLSDDKRKALRQQLKKYKDEYRPGSASKAAPGQNNPSPPGGSSRACLCADGRSYSKDCCTGALWAQGI